MKIKELLEILKEFPKDAVVAVIYPEYHYGEEAEIRIEEITYIRSSSRDGAKNGVFIRI